MLPLVVKPLKKKKKRFVRLFLFIGTQWYNVRSSHHERDVRGKWPLCGYGLLWDFYVLCCNQYLHTVIFHQKQCAFNILFISFKGYRHTKIILCDFALDFASQGFALHFQSLNNMEAFYVQIIPPKRFMNWSSIRDNAPEVASITRSKSVIKAW